MSYQNKADNTLIQAQKQTSRFHFCVPFAIFVLMLFVFGCATGPSSTGMADVSEDQADRPMHESVEAQQADAEGDNIETFEGGLSQMPSLAGDELISVPTFPTFNSTGEEICTNDEGLPVIYMFSSSMCSHCEWGGGAFDFIVRFLTADGLIEAHHYDLLSGDDLLTEEIETKIPADKLEVYRHGNPKDLVPYYNFGCAYDRIGTGYEKENDLVAEGEEIRRVIEALVRMASEDE